MSRQPDDHPAAARLSPTPEELARDVDRAAERVRVMGPRLAARQTLEARLALDAVQDALQRLADLAAEAEGSSPRPVPRLQPHALADQVLVLGHDALQAVLERGDADPDLRAVRDVLDRVRSAL